MSVKYSLVVLSLCFAFLGANKSILDTHMFSLEAKCVMPMLGQTLGEFQIDKSGNNVILVVDIQKNFDEYKVENNSNSNPERVKTLFVVYQTNTNLIGVFWQNEKKEILVTKLQHVSEMIIPCTMWIKDIKLISDMFAKASPAELEKDEGKFGNIKYLYDNTEQEDKYGYIFQDEELTALTQQRPEDYSLLANTIAFIKSSRVITKDEFVTIPDGVQYEDAPQ